MSALPEVSVVVATHDRPARLADLLRSLRAQTLSAASFEVIVVDDASGAETSALLQRERADGQLRLRLLRRELAEGPAAARNDGWRAARAPLVAFTDDDCIASPQWLQEGLSVCFDYPGAIVQGRVDPIPAERANVSPFTRTLVIEKAGPYYQTCNIFYPRPLLEELGGFDEFFTMPGGEDTDLAWRAISRGTPTAFAADARAYHAVNHIGVRGRLRVAAHWWESMLVYKRYPELRKAVFTKRIFWKPWHYALFRVLLALLLPDRLWWLRPYLIIPYVRSIELRIRHEHGTVAHALFYPVEDVVEVGAMIRASLAHRMLVL